MKFVSVVSRKADVLPALALLLLTGSILFFPYVYATAWWWICAGAQAAWSQMWVRVAVCVVGFLAIIFSGRGGD